MRPSQITKIFLRLDSKRESKAHAVLLCGKCFERIVLPFTFGLLRVLSRIEDACVGYSKEMIDRMASIEGTGEKQYESLLQILAEIYVTGGAVEVADRNENGGEFFTHEPGITGQKNPEFESCSNGIWYAVEVKTPRLVSHARQRQSKAFQITARLPKKLRVHWKKPCPVIIQSKIS